MENPSIIETQPQRNNDKLIYGIPNKRSKYTTIQKPIFLKESKKSIIEKEINK
jgi:hypothetical protein